MNKQETANIWVYVETNEGKAKSVGLELLSAGRRLADKTGDKLVAVVIGHDAGEAVQSSIAIGVDEVIFVEGPEYAHYCTDIYANAMCRLVYKYKPSALLIGATHNGRDLGPRIAGRIGTGLTADCTGLDIDAESGNVSWIRPAFGGNLMAAIQCPDKRPQIGTVRPGIFKKGSPDNTRNAPVIRETIPAPLGASRIKLIESIKETMEEQVKLEDAEIIVAGGRGLGKPEKFQLVKDLAQALGGAVGASRGAVGSGWLPHAYQVGQTGKTVSPQIYIACGISGAVQHLAGMSGAEIVIAINKDADAPIFNIADYGIVGDLCEVLPVLTNEIRSLRGV